MGNCNACKNLESIVEGKNELKRIKHICMIHKVEVKITSKAFKDYIKPCIKCNSKDFELKGVVNLGKL